MKYSVIVPVYKNETSIPRLLSTIETLHRHIGGGLEAVFVVDGSPDNCYALLLESLDELSFPAQLIAHSRNFGSFAAIRTGLETARGEYCGVLAADLQEPPELLLELFAALEADECDVAIGTRSSRDDPLLAKVGSRLFWALYRYLIVRDMPAGGVDIFGCNRAFKRELLRLEESRSSLVALVFWLGFRRRFIEYERLPRQEGKSAWTWSRKFDYMADSIFAFTDLPVRLLTRIGAIGTVLSIALGLVVLVARLTGAITVPGYTITLLVILVLGALNLLGLGLVGSYAWRGYENSKHRPLAVTAARHANEVDS